MDAAAVHETVSELAVESTARWTSKLRFGMLGCTAHDVEGVPSASAKPRNERKPQKLLKGCARGEVDGAWRGLQLKMAFFG
eukprot:scaffold76112_cov63-Phaeocystis_antarctica.AAC.1